MHDESQYHFQHHGLSVIFQASFFEKGLERTNRIRDDKHSESFRLAGENQLDPVIG